MFVTPLTRRRTLKLGLGALMGGAATLAAGSELRRYQTLWALDRPDRSFQVQGTTSLKQRAAAKGIAYGSATRYDDLSSDPIYAQHIARECYLLVPEWELKWSAGNKRLRPSPRDFNFRAADWIANFAQHHQLKLRGHTLIWHLSLPSWFQFQVDRYNAKTVLVQHIQTVVKQYAGRIHSWDVVNEAIEPSEHNPYGLRDSPWLRFLGADYIDLAFRVAAAADPNAIRVYNDYALDYDTPHNEAKRTAVLKLLERLVTRQTPIQALGIQAHLSATETRFNPKKFRAFLQEVAALGLQIMITELDVADQELPTDVAQRDRIVAGIYEDYLSVALDEPAVKTVVTWGLSDRYNWMLDSHPRTDGYPPRSLPLDPDFKPKLAWNAIARAFDAAPHRSPT